MHLILALASMAIGGPFIQDAESNLLNQIEVLLEKDESDVDIRNGDGMTTTNPAESGIDLDTHEPFIRLNTGQLQAEADARGIPLDDPYIVGLGYVDAEHEHQHNTCCHHDAMGNTPEGQICDEIAADIGAHRVGCERAEEICRELKDEGLSPEQRAALEQKLKGICDGLKELEDSLNDPGRKLITAACHGYTQTDPPTWKPSRCDPEDPKCRSSLPAPTGVEPGNPYPEPDCVVDHCKACDGECPTEDQGGGASGEGEE